MASQFPGSLSPEQMQQMQAGLPARRYGRAAIAEAQTRGEPPSFFLASEQLFVSTRIERS